MQSFDKNFGFLRFLDFYNKTNLIKAHREFTKKDNRMEKSRRSK